MREFKPGYIFGEAASNVHLLDNGADFADTLKRYRRYDRDTKEGWRVWLHWDMPLSDYISEKGVVPLLERAVAESSGKPKVLDIGIGSGIQWKEWADKIELHGTSLTRSISPELKGKLNFRVSSVSDLHKKFEPNSFDLIFSSMGAHGQELQAIERMIYLLKPGGRALLQVNYLGKTPLRIIVSGGTKHYEIVESGSNYVHLQKKPV